MSKLMYQPQSIEAKWQQFWEETQLFQDTAKSATELPDAEKLYLLFAFAYPSGSGLHVGHVESKTALDILARYYRMKGKNVFFPVGWDAFGLPAENYAIKTGIHPATTTKNAIDTFRRQIKRLGISYDWANEIATNHPEYYKWTQWLFLQLYKKGLAYRGIGMVNWCPKDQTVLANEQVVNGECERCGTKVVQKELEQWYFKITQYQEELLTGLDEVDWPLPTKEQQRHWIGKKEGMEITFELSGQNEHIVCFTTRPDTNYGATFVVLAPEHKLSKMIADGDLELSADIRQKVTTYIEASQTKTELERQSEGKKKTGVFTGLYVTNKLSGKKLPVWISDFVLGGFGTGAVMGVPGHDRRDFEFAQAMGIEIIRVVKGADGDESEITKLSQVIEDQGTMVNSEALNGLTTQEALKKVASLLEEKGIGKRVTTYRLRDWLISRQRYWGAPIPIVYDPDGNPHMVKEEHLPWTLPTDVDFNPTGESPLKSSKEFIERTEKLYGKGWRPEFDTMDTFVDSSWYFLRYVSSRDSDDFANKEQLNYWLPVDLYMIGPEHIVLHLLYSRFFTKFLRDEGYLNFNEPFMKMRHQGMILGPDGKKMSKSKGNVINPDEVVEKYGADTLRMYEMFMGPIESDKPWNVNAVTGVYRFLTRVNSVVLETTAGTKSSETTELRRKLHQTLQKVSDDIPKLKFNTAIAAMMELINVWESTLAAKQPTGLTAEEVLSFVKMLAPFAPFMAEELYHQVVTSKEADSVHLTKWPQWDEALAQSDIKQIPVQVNGKVRALLSVTMAEVEDKEAILSAAKELPTIATRLEGNTVLKELYVPGRIINFVVQEQ